jgi:hypothetical protein
VGLTVQGETELVLRLRAILGDIAAFFAGAAVTVKVHGSVKEPRVEVVEGVVVLLP